MRGRGPDRARSYPTGLVMAVTAAASIALLTTDLE